MAILTQLCPTVVFIVYGLTKRDLRNTALLRMAVVTRETRFFSHSDHSTVLTE